MGKVKYNKVLDGQSVVDFVADSDSEARLPEYEVQEGRSLVLRQSVPGVTSALTDEQGDVIADLEGEGDLKIVTYVGGAWRTELSPE